MLYQLLRHVREPVIKTACRWCTQNQARVSWHQPLKMFRISDILALPFMTLRPPLPAVPADGTRVLWMKSCFQVCGRKVTNEPGHLVLKIKEGIEEQWAHVIWLQEATLQAVDQRRYN